MDDMLGAWDSPAEIRKLDAYLGMKSRRERELEEEIDYEEGKCRALLIKDAAYAFSACEFTQHEETQEYLQDLINLYVDRKRNGEDGAGYEAIFRALDAWLQAEIENYALREVKYG